MICVCVCVTDHCCTGYQFARSRRVLTHLLFQCTRIHATHAQKLCHIVCTHILHMFTNSHKHKSRCSYTNTFTHTYTHSLTHTHTTFPQAPSLCSYPLPPWPQVRCMHMLTRTRAHTHIHTQTQCTHTIHTQTHTNTQHTTHAGHPRHGLTTLEDPLLLPLAPPIRHPPSSRGPQCPHLVAGELLLQHANCMHTHIHTHTHTHTHTYTHTHTHTHRHTHTHIHTHTCTHTQTHTHTNSRANTCTHTHTYTHTHAHTHTDTHTHTNSRANTCTHTHTHTLTRIHPKAHVCP